MFATNNLLNKLKKSSSSKVTSKEDLDILRKSQTNQLKLDSSESEVEMYQI